MKDLKREIFEGERFKGEREGGIEGGERLSVKGCIERFKERKI